MSWNALDCIGNEIYDNDDIDDDDDDNDDEEKEKEVETEREDPEKVVREFTRLRKWHIVQDIGVITIKILMIRCQTSG